MKKYLHTKARQKVGGGGISFGRRISISWYTGKESYKRDAGFDIYTPAKYCPCSYDHLNKFFQSAGKTVATAAAAIQQT